MDIKLLSRVKQKTHIYYHNIYKKEKKKKKKKKKKNEGMRATIFRMQGSTTQQAAHTLNVCIMYYTYKMPQESTLFAICTSFLGHF